MKGVYSVFTVAALLGATAVFAQTVPASLTELNLSNVEVKEKTIASFGSTVRGTLPSGTRVKIDLDGDGNVREVEALGRDTFTVDVLETLLPASALANASWPADARFESIDIENNGRIEIEGVLPDGDEFDAEFGPDGELIEYDLD